MYTLVMVPAENSSTLARIQVKFPVMLVEKLLVVGEVLLLNS